MCLRQTKKSSILIQPSSKHQFFQSVQTKNITFSLKLFLHLSLILVLCHFNFFFLGWLKIKLYGVSFIFLCFMIQTSLPSFLWSYQVSSSMCWWFPVIYNFILCHCRCPVMVLGLDKEKQTKWILRGSISEDHSSLVLEQATLPYSKWVCNLGIILDEQKVADVEVLCARN